MRSTHDRHRIDSFCRAVLVVALQAAHLGLQPLLVLVRRQRPRVTHPPSMIAASSPRCFSSTWRNARVAASTCAADTSPPRTAAAIAGNTLNVRPRSITRSPLANDTFVASASTSRRSRSSPRALGRPRHRSHRATPAPGTERSTILERRSVGSRGIARGQIADQRHYVHPLLPQSRHTCDQHQWGRNRTLVRSANRCQATSYEGGVTFPGAPFRCGGSGRRRCPRSGPARSDSNRAARASTRSRPGRRRRRSGRSIRSARPRAPPPPRPPAGRGCVRSPPRSHDSARPPPHPRARSTPPARARTRGTQRCAASLRCTAGQWLVPSPT